MDNAEKRLWERVASGETLYDDDPDIHYFFEAIQRARALTDRFNSPVLTDSQRQAALEELLGYKMPDNSSIAAPFHCDIGRNIILGRNVGINYDCIFLDGGKIIIGDNTIIGPRAMIITPDHPRNSDGRVHRGTNNTTVTIGHDTWIGAGVTILANVTIGDRCIIGAGAVVNHDIPSDTVAAGIPARPVVHHN
jgi:maltose O-acetyltransferase